VKGVKVVFAHDTEVALACAAALVNTAHGDRDELGTVADLDDFVRVWGWTGTRTHDQAELDAIRALRPTLERLWEVDEDEAVDIVNRLLRDARALPQLVKHGEWDYHLHATQAEAPLVDRMAVEAAMAVTDVIRMKELSRLETCAAEDCNDALVDLSKNRSRRFCSTACSNRTNMAAFRARKAQR
jgi:predicted RNA-binding Zn ribbon-like protein